MSAIKSPQSNAGFTLVEVMVIAPIVILAIGTFVAVMVTMVGDVLASRDRSAMMHETQAALDLIEQDTRLSTQFLTNTGGLPEPQGRNLSFTGTQAFTNTTDAGEFLLFSQLATVGNPASGDRQLAYYADQPNPCGTNESYNRIFLTKVIYFVKNNSLWRRSAIPNWNLNATSTPETLCSAPWQQNSCSPGYTNTTRCGTNDMELIKNVESFNVKYYTNQDDTTDIGATNAKNANTIQVTVNSKKTVAGEEVSLSESVRATRLNDIPFDLPVPSTPNLTYSASSPDRIVFSWDSVASATSYKISYNINGGTWANYTLNGQTTSRAVEAKRGDIITFRVAAHNTSGTSGYTTRTADVPLWTDLDLQYDWQNYGGTYDAAAYTKTKDGTVFVKGLIKGGSTAFDTIIATLPEGYRPAGRLLMTTSSHNASKPAVSYLARVDIDTEGNIRFRTGSSDWLSINLAFIPSSTPYQWYDTPFQNGWSSWGSGYEPVHVMKNGVGRVHIQGLARPGTLTNNTIISTLDNISTAYRPSHALHFMGGHDTVYAGYWVYHGAGELAKRGPQTPSLIGINTMYYPNAYSGWNDLSTINGWIDYGGSYPPAVYTKSSDDVVTLQGLIKSGTATNGTVIGTLPAGYRPKGTLIFNASSSEEYGRVDVLSNGDLVFRSGSSGWFSLNQVSFVADQ